MVIAETKRQMHETLEMKEDEVAQLRSRLQQVTAHKEELQEQKEKAEKSGGYRTAFHCVQENAFLNVFITVAFLFHSIWGARAGTGSSSEGGGSP